jgi:hypothetical protein
MFSSLRIDGAGPTGTSVKDKTLLRLRLSTNGPGKAPSHPCKGLDDLLARKRYQQWPPAATVDELDAAFVVRNNGGQKLAYVYFEDEPGRRAAAKLLTKTGAAICKAWLDHRTISVLRRISLPNQCRSIHPRKEKPTSARPNQPAAALKTR